jgi:HD-GYP domain-containing protein (c-di-GMP phosphodiesterase class II)
MQSSLERWRRRRFMTMPLYVISIPDSELVQKATRLVQEVSPQFLYHHCLRTIVFADLIGQQQEMPYDRELLYLSAIMHDLGWQPTL